VFDMVKRVRDHNFSGGIYTYGLAQNGVGYVYDNNKSWADPRTPRACASSS
jgi:basic membrane lipoprotein Med (substrate-binding protein (PBP1-ABC) superfamily)